MYPITIISPATAVGANTAVAVTASAGFVLVQNLSAAAVADFAFNNANAVPSTMQLELQPNTWFIVRQPPGAAYWTSKTTGVTVTPIEVGV